MRYLLAVLLPPVAVLLCRRPRMLLVNVPLTACAWLPGVAHALLLAHSTAARERADRLADAVLASEERQAQARRRAQARRQISATQYARSRA
jgi:uncharacterized membrane protein YqaE (UPF0057 family)